ncbi:MAG: VOC family protein [Bacteroidota bacterium]|nr:VOC family protein [Bacteroidota bacterium]
MEAKINPDVKIGHIHLTVTDLDKALYFYKELLGFEITQWFGDSAVFLSAGEYHHHIGLNTWAGNDAGPAPLGHTGMYHFGIQYPDRKALAIIIRKLLRENYKIEGASDHGISESVYLCDPDQNGIELYYDRPAELWPRDAEGYLNITTKPLDLLGLLSELDGELE